MWSIKLFFVRISIQDLQDLGIHTWITRTECWRQANSHQSAPLASTPIVQKGWLHLPIRLFPPLASISTLTIMISNNKHFLVGILVCTNSLQTYAIHIVALPAKPAMTLPSPMRRTFLTFGFTTSEPRVTWPSAIMTTWTAELMLINPRRIQINHVQILIQAILFTDLVAFSHTQHGGRVHGRLRAKQAFIKITEKLISKISWMTKPSAKASGICF